MTAVPLRIQRRRTKGWRLPPNTKIVDRSSKAWGNPWSIHRGAWWFVDGPGVTPIGGIRCGNEEGARLVAIDLFRRSLALDPAQRRDVIEGLSGFNLMCWCRLCSKHINGRPLDVKCEACMPCHVDVYAEILGFICT